MDYEKEYKAALQRAKTIYKCSSLYNVEDALVSIFSELAESEDEKIRKEIIYHIQNCDDTIDEETEEKMIAWLEKQKEYKSTYGTEDERIRKEIINVFKSLGELKIPADINFADIFTWLEKQGEQKINSYCQEHCKGYQETGRCFADGECEAKKNAETGWNEEDRDYYDAIIAKLEVTQDDAALTDNQMEFLKSLKDRIIPQLQQEWSEDDERIFSGIILRCEKYGYQEQIDWLKSFKDRCTWKPSDEQMKALYSAINDAISLYSDKLSPLYEEVSREHFEILESLYNDLKKLKGK